MSPTPEPPLSPPALLAAGAGTRGAPPKSLRLGRILGRDGRAVVVALDGARSGPAPGLERPREVVAEVVAGGADAVMTTFGMARAVADLVGRAGLVLALDSEGPVSRYGVEAALRLGADAVELKAAPDDGVQLADVRELAARADRWALPFLVEMLAASWEVALEEGEHSVELVRRAARVGAEAGADLLKLHYAGPAASYRRVVEEAYVPVLVMGGPPLKSPLEVLRLAEEAMSAGAAGVVFGRNVVTSPDPSAMVAALVEVVHTGASATDAVRLLGPAAVGTA